ncbi:hypothetical protein [Ralstonia mannitolilytica]|uniref:Uncharacterized protein n=1 Tax=Ralstonia mannitolilytica TaxID=105219 RepID=A0AAD2AIG4_9RALS|nr:hypothetical protein [Ralstonia mannitolilytica]ANA32105.1 hypothetical protein VZ52_01125 [Ralstonia mannitolilytica]ATG19793.1 hypothetical protein CO705_07930 [Ralstonia pickettii]MBY4719408.1 hypothetical protein [Ralstonia mannitolilytica]CAJ0679238.1 hypothetical protein R77591_00237 [Ralstonia mannitolilytica]
MRRCSNASERFLSIARLTRPTGALLALVLAAGVAATPAASAQTPSANNGYDVSTGSMTVQPGDLGLNRAIADGERRRAARAGNGFSAQTQPPVVLQPQPDYAKYPVYTGVIGDVPIRMRLGRKPGEIDSVHGEYAAGQQPGVRLVTGEYENGGFLMEESDDGTHVTGTWEGAIDAHGIVRGTWTDVAHDGRTLPFVLRPVAVVVIPPYDAAANSNAAVAATPLTPAAPLAPGQIAPPPALPAVNPARSGAHW